MNPKIEKIKKIRLFILNQIKDLTAEQLNTVPAGYKNNIIWNLGHLICAQQSLCYLRAGQPIRVEDRYFSPYLTGTKPEADIPAEEIEHIMALLQTTLDQTQEDYDAHAFDAYTPSERVAMIYGVDLRTIDDALEFLLYHEGFHGGYIVAMKHLV